MIVMNIFIAGAYLVRKKKDINSNQATSHSPDHETTYLQHPKKTLQI